MKALQTFGCCVGLRVNNLKSSIYLAGVEDDEMNSILSFTGFTAFHSNILVFCFAVGD